MILIFLEALSIIYMLEKKVDNNANGEIFNVGEEASKKIDYEKDDDILKEL